MLEKNNRFVAVINDWNQNDKCRKLMDVIYDGSDEVTDRGERSVHSELLILGTLQSEAFIERLWVAMNAHAQAPRYVTRDHRIRTHLEMNSEEVIQTARTTNWFVWQDTIENQEKVLAMENLVADALEKLKTNVMPYIDRDEPVPETAWDVL